MCSTKETVLLNPLYEHTTQYGVEETHSLCVCVSMHDLVIDCADCIKCVCTHLLVPVRGHWQKPLRFVFLSQQNRQRI